MLACVPQNWECCIEDPWNSSQDTSNAHHSFYTGIIPRLTLSQKTKPRVNSYRNNSKDHQFISYLESLN